MLASCDDVINCRVLCRVSLRKFPVFALLEQRNTKNLKCKSRSVFKLLPIREIKSDEIRSTLILHHVWWLKTTRGESKLIDGFYQKLRKMRLRTWNNFLLFVSTNDLTKLKLEKSENQTTLISIQHFLSSCVDRSLCAEHVVCLWHLKSNQRGEWLSTDKESAKGENTRVDVTDKKDLSRSLFDTIHRWATDIKICLWRWTKSKQNFDEQFHLRFTFLSSLLCVNISRHFPRQFITNNF